MASGDTRNYVGIKDVTMIPSIVDIAGINNISIQIFSKAVGAICGMLEVSVPNLEEEKPVIAMTMFGNTTACVDRAREKLSKEGYEVLVFHATGIGGMTMENLVEEGYIDAVLDITTTEWADEICGGNLSAGPTRLEAAGRMGIPHLIVPGCVDMYTFGPKNTVPEEYNGRILYEWNPNITLLRTNIEENKKIGEIFAEKANASQGPVAFLIPLKGVSQLDKEGHPFWWPEADQAMFEALKKNVNPNIPVVEMDLNINDPAFADKAVHMIISMIKSTGTGKN